MGWKGASVLSMSRHQAYLHKWSSLVGLPWEDCGWQIKGSDAISSGVLGLCLLFFFPFLVTSALFKSDLGKLENSPAERDAEVVGAWSMQPRRRGLRSCACLV